MPLTPAHAAAALPLARALPRLPLAALVIGTMAPDFEYLLRLAPRGSFGHTLVGLLVFCLPIGLSAYGVYGRLVRPALLGLLPAGLATALAPRRSFGLGAVAVALLCGALSHVAWDGFTHEGGWAVKRWTVLRAPLLSEVPLYKLLQHGSTVVGAAVVLAWIATWLRRQPSSALRYPPGEATGSARIAIGLLAAAALAGVGNALRAVPARPAIVLGYAAVGVMSGLVAALVLYGAWARSRPTAD